MFDGPGNADIVVGIEFSDDRGDAAVEVQRAGDGPVGGKGEDRGVCRSLMGDVVGEHAAGGEGDDDGVGQRVGKHYGGFHSLLLFGGQLDVIGKADGRFAFHAFSDPGESLHGFDWIFADTGFAAEHDRVSLFVDRVGDVADFGTGRRGVVDHRLEHVGGDDDLAPDSCTLTHDGALDHGQFLNVNFDSEIAASDHDGVGGADNRFDVAHGLLVFDLGDDAGATLLLVEDAAQFFDVFGVAHETDRDKVGIQFDGEVDIAQVLLGQGWQTQSHSGQIDLAPRAHVAGGQRFADQPVVEALDDFEMQATVVDEQGITRVNVFEKAGVVDSGGVGFARFGVAPAKLDDVAFVENKGPVDFPGADRRALEVNENGGIDVGRSALLANVGGDLACPVVLCVTHIESEYVDAGAEQLADLIGGVRGGTEGG